MRPIPRCARINEQPCGVLAVIDHAWSIYRILSRLNLLSPWGHHTCPTSEGATCRMRLLGIDAPEVPHGDKPGQPYGEDDRDYLDHLIGGRTVRMSSDGPR